MRFRCTFYTIKQWALKWMDKVNQNGQRTLPAMLMHTSTRLLTMKLPRAESNAKSQSAVCLFRQTSKNKNAGKESDSGLPSKRVGSIPRGCRHTWMRRGSPIFIKKYEGRVWKTTPTYLSSRRGARHLAGLEVCQSVSKQIPDGYPR